MRAAFYDRQGPAKDVLTIGDLPERPPADGEVAVRVRVSGINPGDMLKRQGAPGSPMAFPRIIPPTAGAGPREAGGAGVAASRLGKQRHAPRPGLGRRYGPAPSSPPMKRSRDTPYWDVYS